MPASIPFTPENAAYWSSPKGMAAMHSAKDHEKHKAERNRRARDKRKAIKAGTWVSRREQRARDDREAGITPEQRANASRETVKISRAATSRKWARKGNNKRAANQRYWQRVKDGLVAGPRNRPTERDQQPISDYDRALRADILKARAVVRAKMATSRNMTKAIKAVLEERAAEALAMKGASMQGAAPQVS